MKKPLPPLHRSLGSTVLAEHIRFDCCGQFSTTNLKSNGLRFLFIGEHEPALQRADCTENGHSFGAERPLTGRGAAYIM